MEVYNCKILVGGSRENEVRKTDITAAEIHILRHIHGDDSVLEVTHVGTSDISDAEVRDMLALTYGPGDVDTTRAGPKILREVFGPPAMPLPKKLEGVETRAKKEPVDNARLRALRDLRPELDVRDSAAMFNG